MPVRQLAALAKLDVRPSQRLAVPLHQVLDAGQLNARRQGLKDLQERDDSSLKYESPASAFSCMVERPLSNHLSIWLIDTGRARVASCEERRHGLRRDIGEALGKTQQLAAHRLVELAHGGRDLYHRRWGVGSGLAEPVHQLEKPLPLARLHLGERPGCGLEQALDLPPAAGGKGGSHGEEGPLLITELREYLQPAGDALPGQVVGTV